jgi:hypothetical protein
MNAILGMKHIDQTVVVRGGGRYASRMVNQRQRMVVLALGGLALVWILAAGGYFLAQHAKVTVEKIRAYTASLDLSKLSVADRAKAIDKLSMLVNALSPEERRQQRGGRDRAGEQWFNQMTDDEKGRFIEATMPTGMKQMIQAFEQMPEDQRKRAVERATKQMAEDQARRGAGQSNSGASQPPINEELRQKIIRIGLQQLYSQSSAQTKAELAPLLEEIQKVMESGAITRGGPRQ